MDRKKEVRTLQSRNGQPRIMRPIFTPLHGTLMNKTTETTIRKKDSQSSLSLKTKMKNLPELKEQTGSYDSLPLLISVDNEHLDDLFRRKLRLCMYDKNEHVSEAESIMKEILAAMNDKSMTITYSTHYNDILTLAASYMYRTPRECPREWLSTSDYYFTTDVIERKNWNIISLVYDITITYYKRRLFDEVDDGIMQCTGDLMKLVVYLTRTCDQREQNKLVYLFLEMYRHIPKLRTFALKMIKSSLYRVVYDNELFVAARPLLKMLAPIVAGFRTPLKKHITLFSDIILPLYRNPYFAYFHEEIFTVILEFMQKDNTLVISLFENLVRYWPRMQPQKQMLFINQIGWLASFVDDKDINKVVNIIASQLMTSLSGCHAAVSETVLRLWEINDFVWLTTQNADVSYPVLVPTIFKTAASHWNLEVRSVATAVLTVLRENNPHVFDAVGVYLKQMESNRILQQMERGEKWSFLISVWDGKKSRKKEKMKLVTKLFVG